jgi:hypothetical protein
MLYMPQRGSDVRCRERREGETHSLLFYSPFYWAHARCQNFMPWCAWPAGLKPAHPSQMQKKESAISLPMVSLLGDIGCLDLIAWLALSTIDLSYWLSNLVYLKKGSQQELLYNSSDQRTVVPGRSN